MSAQQIFRLRNPALLVALAAVFPVLSYAASVANVDFAVGSVMAIDATGVQRTLTKGAEIGNGDTIRTGDGGRAQVRFSDGAMVSLQPKTEFRIDNYQYSGKADGQEKGFFSLLKGGLRTITGLVGRTHRDNYKITTNVATIGIRGTEYSGVLNPETGELVVNTGEGLVEVCNAAGCLLLASGESGTVTGTNNNPQRTDSRPHLSPAQPLGTTQPVFSAAERRNTDGTIDTVALTGSAVQTSIPLVSGSGYAVAYTANQGYPILGVDFPATATFSAANELVSFDNGFAYTATSIAGAFSADGILGWGRWSSGNNPSGSLVDLHYVTGIPTPAADINTLTMTATYNLIGFTLPTAQDGTVGQAPNGSLQANFSGGIATLSLNLDVPIGGTTYSLSGSGANNTVGCASFTVGGTVTPGACGVFFGNGFFAGANASHAGLTYKFDSYSPMGYVSGAAAFKR